MGESLAEPALVDAPREDIPVGDGADLGILGDHGHREAIGGLGSLGLVCRSRGGGGGRRRCRRGALGGGGGRSGRRGGGLEEAGRRGGWGRRRRGGLLGGGQPGRLVEHGDDLVARVGTGEVGGDAAVGHLVRGVGAGIEKLADDALGTAAGGDVQRGAAVGGCGVDVGLLLQEEVAAVEVLPHDGVHERRGALVVGGIDPRLLADEETAALLAAAGRGVHKGRGALLVARLDVGAAAQEHVDHLDAAVERGVVEGGDALLRFHDEDGVLFRGEYGAESREVALVDGVENLGGIRERRRAGGEKNEEEGNGDCLGHGIGPWTGTAFQYTQDGLSLARERGIGISAAALRLARPYQLWKASPS